jgi:[glutamine synthetase] adenylyltransferase / [glutamine synthetase]-adenylyl-L-tyrosine phosphorylase
MTTDQPNLSFVEQLHRHSGQALLPRPSRLKEARKKLAALSEEAAAQGCLLSEDLVTSQPLTDLLLGLCDHSPYLVRLLRKNWQHSFNFFHTDPDLSLRNILEDTSMAWRTHGTSEASLMSRLRQCKQKLALLVALADLGGLWRVETVTEALSDFADAACTSALQYLLLEAADHERFIPVDRKNPAHASGVVVLALGKHGARELNYSSDIDIIVLYDPEHAPLGPRAETSTFFVRLTQALVRLMQERTADGYVLRTDLRLRPDPASTPVAISVNSAFSYYETVGQNWERAALIKARPVAGDLELGARFIDALKPFIWRKYFDFAAIADIHAMKRQIHAVRGHESIAVAGHDIKLGRGGIREVEFFVQTQQLVFGGRRAQLRGRRTLDMLQALQADGWISADAVEDLSTAYCFLRAIEHRLQMRDDEQTQRLPVDEDKLAQFARFCGYASASSFGKALVKQALIVEYHYARLFEEGAELAASEGSLVFTGTVDDPDTLNTLRVMGYVDPHHVAETVRGWHFGRRQAVTSPRAREVLTELVPSLLRAFSQTADPDAALVAFDRALGRMPAAVELFSILKSHDAVLRLFADLFGSAPRLAESVANRPHVLDAVIDPAFLLPVTTQAGMRQRLNDGLAGLESFEDVLDRCREMGQHELFLIGARMVSGVLSPEMAGQAYSLLAEAMIAICLEQVSVRFQQEYGVISGGQIAVFGLGRLGSCEMTATSDLDLIVLYDFPETVVESDGARRLPSTTYYGRLTQRLISALTVPTRRGSLYSVDMRLRPSGNKGPAATQFSGFVAYQKSEAETWERMSLVRSRFLAGNADLGQRAEQIIRSSLMPQRDAAMVRAEAYAMRQMIAQEKGDRDIWDLKNVAGGLIDIEFLCQILVLTSACDFAAEFGRDPQSILKGARVHALLPPSDIDHLVSAHALMRDLMQWIRLTLGDDHPVGAASAGVKRQLAVTAGLPDFKVLESYLRDEQRKVRIVFDRFMKS